MSETTCGDDEGQASPSEGASTQRIPEPATEPEVIEVALGRTPIPYLSVRYVRYGPRYLAKVLGTIGTPLNTYPGLGTSPGTTSVP